MSTYDSQRKEIDHFLEFLAENPAQISQLLFPVRNLDLGAGQPAGRNNTKHKKKKGADSASFVQTGEGHARPNPHHVSQRTAVQRRANNSELDLNALLYTALNSMEPFTKLRSVGPDRSVLDLFGGALESLGPFIEMHFQQPEDADQEIVVVHHDKEDLDGVIVAHEKEYDDDGVIAISDDEDNSHSDHEWDFEVVG